MKNRNLNCTIVMTWRFVSTGLILIFLACLIGIGTGCTSLGNKSGKGNSFSLPSYFQSSKAKPKKAKKTADNPTTLEELLGLPRS
jgi:hypothetical protein